MNCLCPGETLVREIEPAMRQERLNLNPKRFHFVTACLLGLQRDSRAIGGLPAGVKNDSGGTIRVWMEERLQRLGGNKRCGVKHAQGRGCEERT